MEAWKDELRALTSMIFIPYPSGGVAQSDTAMGNYSILFFLILGVFRQVGMSSLQRVGVAIMA